MKFSSIFSLSLLTFLVGCTPAVSNQTGANNTVQASASPSAASNAVASPAAGGNPFSGSTCAAIIAQSECARDKFQAEGDAKHTKAMSNMVDGNKTVKPQLAKANQICQDSYKSLESSMTLGLLDREKINSTLLACK